MSAPPPSSGGARDALRADLAGCEGHHFARGSWGGEFHPDFRPQAADVVVGEHWGSSGFANTDLDFQLKQHGITYVAVVRLLAETCVEATARFAMELGYHVTLVRGATAALSPERMHAAHELTGPTYVHAIVTTAELVTAFQDAQS
ncbi:isochorismatase family cysteine hydrolase [Streptomyces mirabilis]|uniref:isochorismatase family cysteine hydrolase n=1 Tax=Streptomyces mirabilis TaxID=68239 RepID=UPI00367FA3DA